MVSFKRDADRHARKVRLEIGPGGPAGRDGRTAGSIVEALCRGGGSIRTADGTPVFICSITVCRNKLDVDVYLPASVSDSGEAAYLEQVTSAITECAKEASARASAVATPSQSPP